jgi:hypothetical protein
VVPASRRAGIFGVAAPQARFGRHRSPILQAYVQACVPPRWPLALLRAPEERCDHRASYIRPRVVGLGHKLASTKNWKAMAAPNSAVTVTACGGVGTQCAAACSGLGRLCPGPGRAGLHQTQSLPRRRTGYPPPPRPWAPAPLPWPSAAGCPPGSGWACEQGLGSVVRLRLRLRRKDRVRVRACRLLVLHANDACCSTQPCSCGQRARSSSM